MIPDPDPDMTREEYFATLTAEQRLELVCSMIDLLTMEQRNAVLLQLAREQPQGETQLQVNSDANFVRLDFGRAVAWFALPKEHARQLGILLMQHSGATVQQVPNPTRNDGQ